MAYTAYQTNKKTGVVYAYRVESYRDPVTKRPKSRREYLGRVDPVTKTIVEKEKDGKRNRSKLNSTDPNEPNPIPQEVTTLLEKQRAEIQSLQLQLKDITDKYHKLSQVVKTINRDIQNAPTDVLGN